MAPIHPLRASSVVTSQMRRRNRMYRLVIGLLIVAVGSGVVVALLADWLNTLVNRNENSSSPWYGNTSRHPSADNRRYKTSGALAHIAA